MEKPSDSLEIVLAYAREEYEQQHTAHDKLVARAAGFLGFVAALIGLAGLDKPKEDPERWLLIGGVAALIVAALLLAGATWLRQYTTAPDAHALYAKYGEKSAAVTQEAILRTTLDVIADNEKPLRRVQALYQAGATLVAAGAAAVGVAIIVGALS